jgi:ribosome modulation factor
MISLGQALTIILFACVLIALSLAWQMRRAARRAHQTGYNAGFAAGRQSERGPRASGKQSKH